MAKSKRRRVDPNSPDPVAAHVATLRVKKGNPLVIPTGDTRHLPRIREGRVSFEVFKRTPEQRAAATIEEQPDASTKQEAAKVGVRRQRRSVGKKAPLQQSEKKKARSPQAPKTKKHKKGQRSGD